MSTPAEELEQETQNEQMTPEQEAAAEEADFKAGFNDEPDEISSDPTPEPEAAAEPEPEAQAEPEPAPAAPAPVDPVAQQLEQMSNRLRKAEGHIGGLKNHVQTLSAPQQANAHDVATEAAGEQGADAPSKEQFAEALKSGEKMSELKEEFQEWGAAIDEWSDTVAARLENVEKRANTVDVNALQHNAVEVAQSEAAKVRELVRVDAAYPGWEDTINTPEFGAWLQVQTPETIAKIRSPRAADAISVLGLYEKAQQPADVPETTNDNSSKQRRLEAAVTPGSAGGGSAPSVKTEEQEFLAAFNS
jgi:DNA-binding FrmR family transcriptional regulator